MARWEGSRKKRMNQDRICLRAVFSVLSERAVERSRNHAHKLKHAHPLSTSTIRRGCFPMDQPSVLAQPALGEKERSSPVNLS